MFPLLKEGYGREELPLLSGVAAGLVAVTAGVWRSLRSMPRLRGACVAVLLLPLAVYGWLACSVVIAGWRGRALARSVRVTSLAATPIEWPGFDGPVGLRLEFVLEHGVRFEGNLFPPRLRLGAPASSDYFAAVEGVWLQEPVFQKVGRAGGDEPRLAASNPIRLAYDLYPASVQRYEAPLRVCVQPAAEPDSTSEGPVHASFLFVGRNRVSVDLSSALTKALHEQGVPGAGRVERQEMLHRFDPANLRRLGFETCPASPTTWPSAGCWCRPSGAR